MARCLRIFHRCSKGWPASRAKGWRSKRRSRKVRERDGECIGRVGRRGFGQAEDDSNHLRYLPFVRAPSSSHGALHSSGRILRDAKPRARAHEERHASSMAQLGGGLRVLGKEETLHARLCGGVGKHDADELALNFHESIRKRCGRVRVNYSMRHVGHPRPFAPHHTPTEMTRARVESQHDDHVDPGSGPVIAWRCAPPLRPKCRSRRRRFARRRGRRGSRRG